MTPGKGQQYYWPKCRQLSKDVSVSQKKEGVSMKMGPLCVSRGAEESCPSALTVGTDSLAPLRLVSSLYRPLSHGDLSSWGVGAGR